jgi:hypothetical protein
MEDITSSELLERIKLNTSGARLKNLNVTEGVAFSEWTGSTAIFQNCIFNGDVGFDGIHIEKGIWIKDCQFKRGLSFIGITAPLNNGDKSQNNDTISLQNIKVNYQLLIKDVTINNDIRIELNSEISDLSVISFISNSGGVSMDSTTINSILDINNCTLKIDLRIDNCLINREVRLNSIKAGFIVFLKNNFKKDCLITGGELRGGISLTDGIYEENFNILAVEAKSIKDNLIPSITFSGAKFKKHCVINYFDADNKITEGCPEIYIYASDFENALIINPDSSGFEGKYFMEKLLIDASKKLKGELIFNSLNIKRANISGANYDASIIFSNVKFQRLNLEYFTNYCKFQLIDVDSDNTKNASLYIKNSFLGNSQFANVNFLNFNDIIIENSDLSQISTSNVTWFTEENVKQYEINLNGDKKKGLKLQGIEIQKSVYELYKKNTLNAIKQRRELFRQLKYALEKQGDKIQSLVFKRYEMSALKMELRLTRNWWHYERWILRLNQSNDFGQNWFKPVLWTLAITLFFFCLITIIQSPNYIWSSQLLIDSDSLGEIFSFWWKNKIKLIQLFSPVQLLDKLYDKTEDIYSIVYFLFYLHKIILSYLIFQIVSAFRKYTSTS